MQSRLLGWIVQDGATQNSLPEAQAISAATLMVLQEVVVDLRHHVWYDSVEDHHAQRSSLQEGHWSIRDATRMRQDRTLLRCEALLLQVSQLQVQQAKREGAHAQVGSNYL